MREPVVILDILMPVCSLTYGESPCVAALGVSGSRKCYNTRSTCQDLGNFDPEPKVLRFCTNLKGIPKEWNAIPSLISVDFSPTVLNIGGRNQNAGPLGMRATARAVIGDHPDDDVRFDKYLDDRTHNPLKTGTLWTKFLARNKYIRNVPVIIRQGYLGQELEEMQARRFIIDTINGPDRSVTVQMSDPMRSGDDDKALVPPPSPGLLHDDITSAGASTFDVAGAQLSDYPVPGTVRINDELILYDGVTEDDGVLTFSVTERGADGTDPADQHDEGSTVQWCYEVDDMPVWEVQRELWRDYANFDENFIPFDEWQDEGQTWLTQYNVTGKITVPTGVNSVSAELCLQCLHYIWWDEVRQNLELKAIRAPNERPVILTDNEHLLADSVSKKIDHNELFNVIMVSYLPRNATQIRDQQDFQTTVLQRDQGSIDGHGETKFKRVLSRWLRTGAQVAVTTSRLLDQFKEPATYITFSTDAKDRDIRTGQIVDLITDKYVDDLGQKEPRRHIITSAKDDGHTAQYEALLFDFITGRGAFWMNEGAPDYDSASDELKDSGAWWADEAGLIDGEDGYVWQ